MKNYGHFLFLLLLAALSLRPGKALAQAEEAQQLLLNVEKLAQLRSILSDMQAGYSIVQKGYGTVRALSEGSFRLHKTFLDGLLAVSPAVRNYYRVGAILEVQRRLVSEYTGAYTRFRRDGHFTLAELAYLGRVYARLGRQGLRLLDELTLVLTTGELRMSEAERLAAIDRLYAETTEKLAFLRHFNRQAGLLALARTREQADVEAVHDLYHLHP